MSKADRLKLSIKRCRQDIRNLKAQYTITDVKDKPRLRLDKLENKLIQLERELNYEQRI